MDTPAGAADIDDTHRYLRRAGALRHREHYSQQLDPLDLIVRAYEHWDAHRWPGASGCLTCAGLLD